MSLKGYLEQADSQYDPQSHLVWSITHSPGYHTRIADGVRTRQTRQAMDYALANLQSGEPWRVARACDVIDTITALQVIDPIDHHYGIWGWFFEEPPQQMNPADWNWADFIGARLAQMLRFHSEQLRPATLDSVRTALRHAAMSIFRRNVLAGYTNIAIMGGVVSAAAGELLDLPDLLAYGRRRLASVRELAERVGGFSEYNSPTYTRVALEESERGLMLLCDPAARQTCEALRHISWRSLAERFHSGTGQMAGPNSRAYSDWLGADLCRYLTEQTGVPITPRGQPEQMNLAKEGMFDLVRPLPCPPEFIERFRHLPSDPHETITRFATGPRGDTIGTTWLTADACLGSINRGNGWVQTRGLLAYWKTPQDPAVVLRARMLKNGIDFAASRQHNVQRGQRVLSSWSLANDCGPFHPAFDKPAGNIFQLADWQLRISLQGQGVAAECLDASHFVLRAGDWQAVIHTAPVELGGVPVRWQLGQTADVVHLDAVLHEGETKPFDFNTLTLKLAFGIELLRVQETPGADVPQAAPRDGGELLWRWAGLELTAPTQPRPFTW